MSIAKTTNELIRMAKVSLDNQYQNQIIYLPI